jgi:predicted ArsR family transcriptional regulator
MKNLPYIIAKPIMFQLDRHQGADLERLAEEVGILPETLRTYLNALIESGEVVEHKTAFSSQFFPA